MDIPAGHELGKIELPPPVQAHATELPEQYVGFALSMRPQFCYLLCQCGVLRPVGCLLHAGNAMRSLGRTARSNSAVCDGLPMRHYARRKNLLRDLPMQCRRRFASVLSIACCALALAVVCAKPGRAQDPLTAFPKNYSRLFSNEAVDVIRVHYGPHERVGVHDHSELPTVYVYLSDSGPVRFQHDEVPPFTLVRKPVEKGSYRVSPGRLERHTVENLGDESSDFCGWS